MRPNPASQQRSAIPQYLLFALVAVLSLLHAYGGARFGYRNFIHGQTAPRLPFSSGYRQQTITGTTPEARAAGLQSFDTILAIDGQPYTGLTVLTRSVEQSRVGDSLAVTSLHRPGGTPRTSEIRLAPHHASSPTAWETILLVTFSVIPLTCLLIGLWAVLARPRNVHAWLILGILAYFDPLFLQTHEITGRILPFALFWNTTAQTLMPLCLMFFGVYFPQRSNLDRRVPWVKWIVTVPILLLYPLDLFYEYGQEWNFGAIHWLSPYIRSIDIIENLLSFLAICWFFPNIVESLRLSTGDARRRLRVLYIGTNVGLTPFGLLVIASIIRKVDVGQDVPRWLDLTVFLILLLFPMSLAYAVVVQRALDVRILVRQGTRYFFARHTLTVVRFVLGVWLGFEMFSFFSHTGHRRNVDSLRMLAIVGIFFCFRFLVRRKLQVYIDQRFFREAYSSEQMLSELADEARNFTEAKPLLETITRRIGTTLHIERIAVFLRSGDTFQMQFATGMPIAFPGSSMPVLSAHSAAITTLSRAKAPASVYRDDPSSWLVDASDAERLAIQDLSAELLVPLPGRNRLIGVMALGPKRSEEPYSRTDRQLLQTVAAQTGLALENAELLETLTAETSRRERISREIEIAREVQERLFPQVYPSIEGLDMAGFCRPAQAVGGDYYDLFSLGGVSRSEAVNGAPDPGRLALAIGDISGKGISAALLMASLRASLRSLSRLQQASGTSDLAGLMRHLNDLVYEASASNRYATFFFAELDPRTRRLIYVNAGHNPPVILRGGETIALEATGMVVGLLPGITYAQAQIDLEPGDVLLAFTDGISEAMTSEEEEWGEERMFAATRDLLADPERTWTAAEINSSLMEQADRFTAGAPQHDDMTLLVCRLLR